VRVRGLLDSPQALRALFARLGALAERRGMPLGISAYALSPEAMRGIEPLSAELVADLGGAPDRVFVPVGGGGLLSAVWRGFAGSAGSRLHAVQPDTNDTLVGALRAGEARAREVTTVTRISGLGVQIDLDATSAMEAVRASGGSSHVVDESLVWEMQALLAQREGLYVEPAGAVAVAGLWRAVQAGEVRAADRIVCLLTGHGFKDDEAGRRMSVQGGGRDETVDVLEIHDGLLERLAVAAGP
jgi:threonine synthase